MANPEGHETLSPETLDRLADIARERCVDADPAHDFLHVRRVADNARRLAEAEGANVSVAVAAALLHELFNYPKNHPESHLSGEVAAQHAREALATVGCPEALAEAVCECIRVHGFSRGITPDLFEARILQDADRLDAIGAIGIARCFATCSSMGRPFYSPFDPLCHDREPDDKQWGVDHFFKKLLKIADGLHTQTARDLAAPRVEYMREFLRQLESEIDARQRSDTTASRR